MSKILWIAYQWVGSSFRMKFHGFTTCPFDMSRLPNQLELLFQVTCFPHTLSCHRREQQRAEE